MIEEYGTMISKVNKDEIPEGALVLGDGMEYVKYVPLPKLEPVTERIRDKVCIYVAGEFEFNDEGWFSCKDISKVHYHILANILKPGTNHAMKLNHFTIVRKDFGLTEQDCLDALSDNSDKELLQEWLEAYKNKSIPNHSVGLYKLEKVFKEMFLECKPYFFRDKTGKLKNPIELRNMFFEKMGHSV